MRAPVAVAVAALLLGGCGRERLPAEPAGGFGGPVTVRFSGAPPIRAEVARTQEQRQRGLMQREEVPEGTGMIFVYPQPVRIGFWMKGTLVPLSIAYVLDGRVVSTAEMTPCRSDPCDTYPPAGDFTVAVEAPAGFFPRYGVHAGTEMTVEGDLGTPS